MLNVLADCLLKPRTWFCSESARACACVGSCCACVRRPAWPLHPVPLETFALLVEDVGVEQHMCTAPGLFGKFVGIIAVFLN